VITMAVFRPGLRRFPEAADKSLPLSHNHQHARSPATMSVALPELPLPRIQIRMSDEGTQ